MDAAIKEIIDNATISVNNTAKINRSEIQSIITKYKFCRITGLLNKDHIIKSRELIEKNFSINQDNPVHGEKPEDVQSNFQKLSIGHARHGGVDRPRLMRVFYNPIWSEDIYQLQNTFTKISQVRNVLSGLPMNFAVSNPENGMWTASRIHLFPRGGGFMVTHKDTVLPTILEQNGFEGGYYQPVALLTQKGEDFFTGGGTIELAGEMIEYEDYTSMGDIVIYNSLTCHGVNDIDPGLPFRQESTEGRMSALVTLYKDLVNH